MSYPNCQLKWLVAKLICNRPCSGLPPPPPLLVTRPPQHVYNPNAPGGMTTIALDTSNTIGHPSGPEYQLAVGEGALLPCFTVIAFA